MSLDRQPVSARVLDQAIAWQLRLGDGAVSAQARKELQRWLNESAEHGKAWAQLGGIDQQLGTIDSPTARRALQLSANSGRRTAGRALLSLALLGTLGVGTALQSQPLPVWLADEHTGAGEQLSVTLADNSYIQLNSRSALDVHFDQQERRVFLHRGEVLVETAPGNDPRPFIVETEQGDLRALGTRFIVRQEGNATRLVVLRSAVAALPSGLQAGRTVQAGEQVLMHRDHLDQNEQAPAAADAWSRGMLVVEDLPLAELLAKLREYRPGYLGLDPSLESLRISGSFPLHDTDRALAALPPSLPVQIERHTDWWVKVVPAQPVSRPDK
ncbi:FecR domain-containing protein [Pseudomonas sp. 9Ag]|uniref:FecR domain-containing protein n=1 Tax=Pseudomonas sp. 9Ag TaxID=2653167 RepID=UPI0012EFBE46|nr:FecR family protein [Pseudomonas sp. 9Ag]VXC11197.1 Amino acid ABC transporter substrate-binding protein [Pseudomonas sp. 9Ag]